ncbi:MAG: DUF86 domain-containing protein [Caldilineales bacterium]|nr:DUF86 domain-containing protein [Caldilineales bacterium]MDW8319322.1 DUF86 domain-containing protein [Anaerolineae bacterium]
MKPSTSDPLLVHQVLASIATAIERIERRFRGIERAEDFLASDEGIDRLDGITMMLIAIGEQVKQLERVSDVNLAHRFPEVDWKGAKGIRDFLSHHYFFLDAEVIFDVCQNKLGSLKRAITALLEEYPG